MSKVDLGGLEVSFSPTDHTGLGSSTCPSSGRTASSVARPGRYGAGRVR